jgi:hypothetical protein
MWATPKHAVDCIVITHLYCSAIRHDRGSTPKQAVDCTVITHYYCSAIRHARGFPLPITPREYWYKKLPKCVETT